LRTEQAVPRQNGRLAGRVRLEMSSRGFALVDTPRFFDDGLLVRLQRGRTVIPFHSPRWRQFPQLARYGRWLEALLAQALPGETLALVTLEFRHEPAGTTDPEVDRLHADGSYLRSVCTPYGRPTVYHDGTAEHPVPGGQTLLMTATGRARAVGLPCTLHRRPGPGPERGVIVCSFEPRREPHPNASRGLAPGRNAERQRRRHRKERTASPADWEGIDLGRLR
jgi:hypothetical protein